MKNNEIVFFDYKIHKIKSMLKLNKLFFFNGVKLNPRGWTSVEQTLKDAESNFYHKISKVCLKDIIKNSILKRCCEKMILSVHNLLIDLGKINDSKLKKKEVNISPEKDYLKSVNTFNNILSLLLTLQNNDDGNENKMLQFLAIKINNKVYSNAQIQLLIFFFNYKNVILSCFDTLKLFLKNKVINKIVI